MQPDKEIDAIFELIRTFNFERIEKTMIALDWKWGRIDTVLRIPRIDEMKDCCINLLLAANKENTICSTGGFEASCKINDRQEKTFTLRFVVEQRYERV